MSNLPDFEGEPVFGATVRITRAGDGLSEALRVAPKALHNGEEVHYVLKGVVRQINHRQKDEDSPMVRVHTVEAVDITEVDADLANKILTEAATELAKAKADADGQIPFDGDDDDDPDQDDDE